MHRRAHITHRGHRRMPLSRWESLAIHAVLPALVIAVAVYFAGSYAQQQLPDVSLFEYVLALGASLFRITAAYAITLAIGIPLGILTLAHPSAERILMPIWDVLESIPVLVFFPVIIVAFAVLGGYTLAAIVIMALSMVWDILLQTVGGLRLIPEEVRAIPKVFSLTRLQAFRHVIFPALIPSLVTGSLLAWAEGWNMLMVAEVIHTYLPNASESDDLFGIGSILVHASAAGDTQAFLVAVGIMVAVVAVMNIFLWQPLLSYSERFRFE